MANNRSKLKWTSINVAGSSRAMQSAWAKVETGLEEMRAIVAKNVKPSKDEVVKINLFYGKPTYAIAPVAQAADEGPGATF